MTILPVHSNFIHQNVIDNTKRGRDNVLNAVASPSTKGRRIHLNLVAIRLIQFDQQNVSSFLTPNIMHAPSNIIFVYLHL